MIDNEELSEELVEWLNKEIPKYENIKSKDEFSEILKNTEEHKFFKENHSILSYADVNENSILSFATARRNFEFVKFLISDYSYLIRQLPYENKVKISKDLYDANETDLLCDLLEFNDFPFPNDFDKETCNDERLKIISEKRLKFHEAISSQDLNKIDEFIEKNGNLKYVFDCNNVSALERARSGKKFAILFYLKSRGFQASEFDDYSDDLDEDDIKKANVAAEKQMEKNVIASFENVEKSVLFLIARSKIHNLKENKNNEKEYRLKIKEWFEAIFKVKWGDWLLKTACQCENLEIIFDFQADSVKHVDPSRSKDCAGITYPKRMWILIGAKSDDKSQEQKVKGVIAHELCHYILRIVFENNEFPYYVNNVKAQKKFKEIVDLIEKLLSNPPDLSGEKTFKDDECDGIISSVYDLYEPNDYPIELIVRVFQILVQYDNDKFKSDELERIYANLFEFFEFFVLPELKVFNLDKRLKIRKFNKKSGLLTEIKKDNFGLFNTKMNDVNLLSSTSPTAVYSNLPELVFSSIYANVRDEEIFDAKNIFIYSKDLEDVKVFNDINHSLQSIDDLKIFISCTEKMPKNIKTLVKDKTHTNIIVVIPKEKYTEYTKMWKSLKLYPKVVYIDYSFDDLSEKTKLRILQKKIQFQIANSTLFDLLSSEKDSEKLKNNIIDEEILKLFVKNLPILIDSRVDEKFDYEPQDRLVMTKNEIELSKVEFLNDIDANSVVFISGDYGSGKSWALKILTNNLREIYPKSWVSYVDLQQYTNDIKSTKLNFADFVIETVLKLEKQYEKNIFNFLYQNGRVIFLVDDINDNSDEIRRFLNKLIKSFNTASKNKLIIASRNCKNWDEILQKNATEYVLNDFSIENGHQLFNDVFLEDKDKGKLVKIAKELSMQFSKLRNHSIKPIFYKMIADFSKNNINDQDNLTIFNVLKSYVDEQYSKIQNSNRKLPKARQLYNEQHWCLALDKLIPKLRNQYNNRTNNIESNGFITKIDFKDCFVDNIFRDYFTVEYILSILMDDKANEDFGKAFNSILHLEEYSGIRILLNSSLSGELVYNRIEKNSKSFAAILSKEINLLEMLRTMLSENLDNFVKIIKILHQSTKLDSIVECLKKLNPVENIQSFKIVKKLLFLNPKSAEKFIINEEIFQKLIGSNIEIDEVKQFAKDLDSMHLSDCLRKALQIQTKVAGENIVHLAFKDFSKIKGTFELINDFFSSSEIIVLLNQTNKDGNTFLHIFAQNKKNSFIFESNQKNTMCDLVLRHFDEKKLKELLLKQNKKYQTFLHILIIEDKSEEIKRVFEILKDKNQVCESLLNSNHYKNRNLLQLAALESIKVSTHQDLWSIYKENYKVNEKFIEIIKAGDDENKNILQIAACTATSATFEFLMSNIEHTFKADDNGILMKSFFNSFDDKKQNLLQLAAEENASIEFHLYLWTKIENYFIGSDFFDLVNYIDENGWNILVYVNKNKSEKVKKFVNNEVKRINRSYLNQPESDVDTTNSKLDEYDSNQNSPEASTEIDEECEQIETIEDNVIQQNVKSKQNLIVTLINTPITSVKYYNIIILILLFIICYLKCSNYESNSSPFMKLNPEVQLKIKETRVLYKKINVKFDNLFYNTYLVYEKITNDHLKLLQSGEIVDLDDARFFALTNIIVHKYDNLDSNLKDKIHNSMFLYNNEPVKFDIVSKMYPDVLSTLTSDQIILILSAKIIRVGEIVSEIKPIDLLEKHEDFPSYFLKYLKFSNKQYEIISRSSIDKIIDEESHKFNFFILKQEVLNHELKSFDLDYIAKLKRKNPKYFISYIDLREGLKHFSDSEDMENPMGILKLFVNLKHEFENSLFMSSYKSGKTVLMWDGFDEISLKYREIVVNLISFIHQNTYNIQVVSVQLSFENLEEKDQTTIKRSLIQYKNILLKLNELFLDNSEVYAALTPNHASQMLNNEILNLSDPEFEYLEKFVNHSWDSLDQTLKDKVLNSELIFQNERIKIKLIDQLYPEIFTTLTSEQICHILDEKTLEIGKFIENPIDPIYLDEKSICLKNNNTNEKICSNDSFWNHQEEFNFLKDDYELVNNNNLYEFIKISKPQNRQFYILTLETSLEVIKGFDQNSILKVKEMYPFQWIAYINRVSFNNYQKKHNYITFNIELMLEDLFRLNFESEFEKKFIKASYNSGGFIFFWDGFFETSSEKNEDINEILSLIYKSTQNIQFITSQTACDQLILTKTEINTEHGYFQFLYEHWVISFSVLIVIVVGLVAFINKKNSLRQRKRFKWKPV